MGKHLERAWVLIEQSRHDLAEAELRQELAEDPNSATAHALLGLCLARRERFDEATREAELAVHLWPDLPFAHYALGSILLDRNRLEEAETAARRAIELDPHMADFFGLLTAIQFNGRRWQEALQTAESGLALDPEHVMCNNLRAMALVKLGRRAEAGMTIAGTLARDPEDALSHANQGWTLLEQGNPQKAMEHFREALRLEPNLDWARHGIVEALKARNIIYRVMLWYFLAMARLSRRAQWAIIIGGVIGYNVLRNLARDNPALAPYIWPLLILYLIFVVLTWTADALFNLLLRVSRFGRLALSPDQITASNLVGSCLLAGLGAVIVALIVDSETLQYGGIFTGLLVLPVSAIFHCQRGWPRTYMTLYTLALAALAYGGLALLGINDQRGSTLLSFFFLGIFFSGFVANALAMSRVRR